MSAQKAASGWLQCVRLLLKATDPMKGRIANDLFDRLMIISPRANKFQLSASRAP